MNPFRTMRTMRWAPVVLVLAAVWPALFAAAVEPQFEVATFTADVTPPIGHPLLGGLRPPARAIKDRLEARGVVLFGAGKPIVLLSVDWCELRNDAYDRWREAVAEAVGTTRARVLLAAIHQHDAPYADLTGQRVLDAHKLSGAMFDPHFFEVTVRKVADAAHASLEHRRRVTHLGLGQAKVERIASNRRVVLPDGTVRFNRGSQARDPVLRGLEEGTIDPWLKTISLWDGEQPVVAIHSYATHPMSYYGGGEVSYDFPGMARAHRQKDDPDVFQVYTTGCGGDVTAGKYSEPNYAGRMALADRLYQAMVAAWQATKKYPLEKVDLRVAALKLDPEVQGALAPAALEKKVADEAARRSARIEAALGLSWQKRCAAGQPIDVPCLDFGPAQLVLLPAESFVDYQLMAQKMRPDSFVMVAAYSECAPGYIPTEQTRKEGFIRDNGYTWVAAGSEEKIRRALQEVLVPNASRQQDERGQQSGAADQQPSGPQSVGIRAPDGFEVSLYAGDELAHDIFSMTLDAQGRVVVAGRGYVKTLHDDDGDGRADRATLFSSVPGSGAHGMYFDGPDLMVSGDNALMRLRDTDGDGQADGRPEILATLRHPEHGTNGIAKGPDGWFYVVCGNDAGVGAQNATTATSPVRQPECGALVRFAPDGRRSEVVAHGFRNPYDLNFGARGQVFTVDADGERDQYLPWYTPTRLFDISQGMHHGWVQHGWQHSWNRPACLFDSGQRAAELGRGSPTGLIVCRHRAFPADYYGNVLSCCWTMGRVYRMSLAREGSSWKSTPEIFLETTGEVGFAPVDLAIGPQGDLFVAIGGRGTRGSVFRVRWTGESAVPRRNEQEGKESDSVTRVLSADQPLAAWSRARWVPAARKLGAEAFEQAALRPAESVERRLRAIEILVELFGGLRPDVAAGLAGDETVDMQACAAWALGRQPYSATSEKLLVGLTHAADPAVRRAAWETLAVWRDEPADALASANWQSLARTDDRRVRSAAIRAAAERLKAAPPGLDHSPAGRLAAARMAMEVGGMDQLDFASLTVLLAAADQPELQLEVIRLMQLALGDVQLEPMQPEAYVGYVPRKGSERAAPAVPADVVAQLAKLFPYGKPNVDRELARLLGMLGASDVGLLERVAAKWSNKSHVEDDLHYLIVLSLLGGERSAEVTRQTAAALAGLHPKMIAGAMYASRNWPLRVGEIFQQLVRRDAALSDALIADRNFQLPAQSLFATTMPERAQRMAAARKLLAAVQASEEESRWTPQLVNVVATLPSTEALPALRDAWEDFALQDDVALALARQRAAEDRFRFVERLASPQPNVVQAMARVLRDQQRKPSEAELLATMRALRRACAVPQQKQTRAELVALLASWTGQSIDVTEPTGADVAAAYQPWFDWFARAYPAAARQLAGLGASDWRERIAASGRLEGDVQRGRIVFAKRACQKCHLGDSRLGPELGGVAKRFSRVDLLASIVDPNRAVSPLYQTTQVITGSGKVYTGLVVYESPESTLLQTAPDTTVRIAGDEIVSMKKSGLSLMPTGLLDGISNQELADLFAFLSNLKPPR